MMRKDVQRSFVLLRQCGNGRESGYARAETREGKVRLNLVVQGFAPQEEVYAFGTAQDGVLLIGLLNVDGRGQGGIAAELSAQEMRSLQVLFVAALRGGGADIPLAGTVGRGGWVDWAQVRALVAEALRPAVDSDVEDTHCVEEAPDESVEDETEIVEEEAVEDIVEEAPVVLEEEAPADAEEASAEEDYFDQPAEEDPFEAVERSLRTPLPREERRELPEALRNAYWPQQLWPLHDLFERFEAVQPFEGEGAVYVRVPLGGKWGRIDHYLVGASVKDSWVTGVGYLIPGGKDAPPAGLAGYEWADGYWQAWQFVENEE